MSQTNTTQWSWLLSKLPTADLTLAIEQTHELQAEYKSLREEYFKCGRVNSDRLREIWRMKDDIRLLEHEIRDPEGEKEKLWEEVEILKIDNGDLRSKLHAIGAMAEAGDRGGGGGGGGGGERIRDSVLARIEID
jgi:chromosome segregation ATPase